MNDNWIEIVNHLKPAKVIGKKYIIFYEETFVLWVRRLFDYGKITNSSKYGVLETCSKVKAMGIEIDVPKIVNPDVDLEIGDTVEVAKGPFSGQVGNVEEINLETKEAKVCIDAFGKKTLFVIEFENIQKI